MQMRFVVMFLAAGFSCRTAVAQSVTQFPGLFEQRCAACHENPSGDTQAPSRQALMQMSPQRVHRALTVGSMAPNTIGLTDAEIFTLVQGLTGRPLGDVAISASSMKNRCGSEMLLRDPLSGPRWNGVSPDAEDNARFQPAAAAGLTAEQVPRLKLKWAFGFPGGVSAWGPVTVAGGRLFVGSDNGAVYALDPGSGCVHWSFEAKTGVRTAINIGPAKGVPGVRYLAYFGDIWANVYALDAESGKPVWTTRADDHKQARILASLALDVGRGRLYVPVTSLEGVAAPNLSYECCRFRGNVVALEPNTGRQIWKQYTIPEAAQPLRKTSTGTQLFGPAGGAVWNTPTIDLKAGALYFGSGNDYIWPGTEFTDAIRAVDLATGAARWVHQLLAGDVNDGGCGTTDEQRKLNCPNFNRGANDDVAAPAILRSLPNGRRVLIAMQESATVTALDPDRQGAVLWQRHAGDGPSSGPGFGAAADGDVLYVPTRFADRGGLAALRLATGERLWYITLPKPTDCPVPAPNWCSSAQAAAVTAIPGIVFAGARDGMLRAYSSRDGRIVWEFQTRREFETVNGVPAKGGTIAGAGPTVVGGMVFIGSGYAGQAMGNALLAFGVD